MTTPQDTGIEERISRLHQIWKDTGRDGQPEVTALAGRVDHDQLASWAAAGVTEVLYGLPDRGAEDVEAYLGKLAGSGIG